MTRIRRLLRSRVVLPLLLALSLVPLATGPAGAASSSVLDATCTGGNTTTYQPGLTDTPATVTVQGTISMDCVSTDLTTPLLLHGTITGGGTGTLSCALLQSPTSGSSTIVWTTVGGGSYATSAYDYTTSLSPGTSGTTVLTLTGTVTSGLYAGDGILIATVFANLDLTACSSPTGLTSRSGVVTAEFSSLL
ncbi:hypothetical protein CP967_04235 [Streptomyces nitrosporeus]|uniref:Ig-like domain-containing protein n=1 Tax=Streptomyces nitrosporeus TaxID=28894 RepID=A0A5J6F8K6_9ACTN|nr:hypothetical protein [Streptomyces nitrosporeus]QEU71270.1 hypothetical protein CP967_04235 [Streptomyces nitrosporeus]GGY99290.1 hypothetical protein GCM10010327_32380 [Streptomyces nitrosporeus]